MDESSVTVAAGVVDVLVLAPASPDKEYGWRVLTLRRAVAVRCTGAWEVVHGSVESGELPEDAAIREVREETGLTVARLYSVTVNPFYFAARKSVQLAVVFAAIVNESDEIRVSEEHDAWQWRSPEDAKRTLSWPRSREALGIALEILDGGDAGPREDVLRIR